MINKNVETSGPWALICQLLNEHTSSSEISLCRSHRNRHCTYMHRFMCNTYLWIWGYWKVIHLRGCFSHQTRKGEASSPSISLSCHDPIMPVSIEHNSLSSMQSLESVKQSSSIVSHKGGVKGGIDLFLLMALQVASRSQG